MSKVAPVFSDEIIFGKGFSRTKKSEDTCAVIFLLDQGYLDITGRVIPSPVNNAKQDVVRKHLWQYVRYLHAHNKDKHPFSSFGTNDALSAKALVDAMSLNGDYSLYNISRSINNILDVVHSSTSKMQHLGKM